MMGESFMGEVDLALAILSSLVCVFAVLFPPLSGTPVRFVFGLSLVFFLPGYSLVAALFPRRDDLGGLERVAVSFGLSVAVVPLLALVLNYTPFGIRLAPVLTVLSVFTILLSLLAWVRRIKVPAEQGSGFPLETG